MAKTKTVYVCSNCGADSPKWVGKCPSCGEWNTYVEEIVATKESSAKRIIPGITETGKVRPVLLRDITSEEESRIDLKDEELNRVLGGGLVKGRMPSMAAAIATPLNPSWFCVSNNSDGLLTSRKPS